MDADPTQRAFRTPSRRYLPLIRGNAAAGPVVRSIGVLPGEGSGPEIVVATLAVLDAVAVACGTSFDVRIGGSIGEDAERQCGAALSEPVAEFCADVFAAGGAILAGAGGGRFVYELRRRFDLFCKLNPIAAQPELHQVLRTRPRDPEGIDVLVVRENLEGVYHSEWRVTQSPCEGRRLEQASVHSESGIRRVLSVAARIACVRRGGLAIVVKRGGLPPLAALWEECAREAAADAGVGCEVLDVDHAAYRIVQHPESLDVVVGPNLFGDILSDLGGVLMGSRALTHGASFSDDGAAVYQTNHGAAHDLARTDRANPAGQILALAMLLRESFALEREAELVERALREVWAAGFRTDDLREPGATIVGTRELADRVSGVLLESRPARIVEGA